jgi:hypothetical protein
VGVLEGGEVSDAFAANDSTRAGEGACSMAAAGARQGPRHHRAGCSTTGYWTMLLERAVGGCPTHCLHSLPHPFPSPAPLHPHPPTHTHTHLGGHHGEEGIHGAAALPEDALPQRHSAHCLGGGAGAGDQVQLVLVIQVVGQHILWRRAWDTNARGKHTGQATAGSQEPHLACGRLSWDGCNPVLQTQHGGFCLTWPWAGACVNRHIAVHEPHCLAAVHGLHTMHPTTNSNQHGSQGACALAGQNTPSRKFLHGLLELSCLEPTSWTTTPRSLLALSVWCSCLPAIAACGGRAVGARMKMNTTAVPVERSNWERPTSARLRAHACH